MDTADLISRNNSLAFIAASGHHIEQLDGMIVSGLEANSFLVVSLGTPLKVRRHWVQLWPPVDGKHDDCDGPVE